MAEETRSRGKMSEAVEGIISTELLQAKIEAALNVKKKERIACPHCNKISFHSVDDSIRQLEAVHKLIEQIEGKPGTVDAESEGLTVVVERLTPSLENA